MIEHSIYNLKDYPDDGNHQECFMDLPFKVTKGEDAFIYTIKEKEYTYNKSGNDQRWFCNLKYELDFYVSPSLEEIFEFKVHKDLNIILEYCRKLYVKSLKMEIKRSKQELKKYKDNEFSKN